LLSPSFTVRTVRWNGVVQPVQSRLQEVEAAVLGRPLMLLSQNELEDLLQVDSRKLRLRFERHLPGTLEIVVMPRLAAWVVSDGRVFDAQGRPLDSSHAVPGLKRVDGFTLTDADGQPRPEEVRLLRALLDLERQSGLWLQAVARRGDDLVLTLSPSGQQVWLRVSQFELGLQKLRMLGRRHDGANLPSRVDLRFRNQIVLASTTREARRGD
jgi:hypothetical protein